MRKIKKIIIPALLILLTLILLAIFIISMGGVKVHGPDLTKIRDLREITNVLELYYKNFKKYPHVEAETVNMRWQQFSDIIVSSGIDVHNVPQDRSAPDLSYDYKDSYDGQSYVLKAIFVTDIYNSLLANDIDGIIYGIDCGINSKQEKEYCITQ